MLQWGCGLGRNWKLHVVSSNGMWVGPKYLSPRNTYYFKMLSFTFFFFCFKVNTRKMPGLILS